MPYSLIPTGAEDFLGTSFDTSSTDKLLKQLEEERKKRKEEQKIQSSKEDKKSARRKRLIEALPFIAAALTAKDSGQSSKALLAYADLVATQKERAKERAQELEKQRRAIEAEKQKTSEYERYATSERVAGQKYQTSERVASELSAREREDKKFVQNLAQMGYGNTLQKQVEELQHNYRLEEANQGFVHNAELQSRQIAAGLANQWSGIIRPDTAMRLADKVSRGGKPNDVERATLEYLGQIQNSRTEQEQKSAMVDYIYKINHIEVPVEGIDPQMSAALGRQPSRNLTFDEIGPFVFKDPTEALKILSHTPPNQRITSEGEPIISLQNRQDYNKGADLARGTGSTETVVREAASRINSINQAAEFAHAIYSQYGYQAAKGMIDNLPIPSQFKDTIIKAVESAEADKMQREKEMNNLYGTMPAHP